SLDESVGRVLDHLQSRRLVDNTIVVFTSDNGGYIGVDRKGGFTVPCTNNFPLRSGKGSLYEGGVRVPLIIRWPGATAGERTQPVATCDLFFTLLAAAGLSPASDQPRDGIDLAQLVRDDRANVPRDSLYWHYPHYYETTTPVSAVRSGDWKLLEYFEDGRRELFQLRDDPREAHDVAASQPGKVAELSRQLAAWRNDVGAKLPQPNPQYRQK
ncbi:MAG: sulfatase-like hydrolase/transferase, partial [Planctomycetia bacterium]|nr:sulfatase-like hydrolase/transferase [Planctomycetia bacterium]